MPALVTTTRDGSIATVSLANAEKRNALTLQMWRELNASFRQLSTDNRVRAVLVRGDPQGKAFCAGADVSEFPDVRANLEAAMEYKDLTHETLERIVACPVPVLAVIDGPCVGGGLEIALAADIRLASDRSGTVLGLPAVRLSNTVDLGDIQRLAAAAGPGMTAEILYSGSTIGAQRAYTVGLVNWLGAPEELENAAREMATRIAGCAPGAVRLLKQGLRSVLASCPGAAEAHDAGVQGVLSGPDFAEGTKAFVEKRTPIFEDVPAPS